MLSYGDFAPDYERILVPQRFARPGRTLLQHVARDGVARLLDVGTGTGTILDSCGHRFTLAVGVDPDVDMLRMASAKGHRGLAVGALPDLPFASHSFDAVVAGFVLSHVTSIDASLRDMRRTLRSRGLAAISSWATVDNHYRSVWRETLQEFIDLDPVLAETSALVPSEAALEEPGQLHAALDAAGFLAVGSAVVPYDIVESVRGFIEARSLLLSSKIVRARIGSPQWHRLVNRARERLTAISGETLRYDVRVHMAWGQAPGR